MLAHQLLSRDGTPVHNPLYQFWRVPLTTTRNWNINTSVQPLTFTLALLSARSRGRRRRVSPLLNDLKANKGAQVSRLNPYFSNWNIRKGPAKMANLSAPWDNTSIASKILEWSCCTALTNHYLTLMLFLLYCTPSPLPPPRYRVIWKNNILLICSSYIYLLRRSCFQTGSLLPLFRNGEQIVCSGHTKGRRNRWSKDPHCRQHCPWMPDNSAALQAKEGTWMPSCIENLHPASRDGPWENSQNGILNHCVDPNSKLRWQLFQ